MYPSRHIHAHTRSYTHTVKKIRDLFSPNPFLPGYLETIIHQLVELCTMIERYWNGCCSFNAFLSLLDHLHHPTQPQASMLHLSTRVLYHFYVYHDLRQSRFDPEFQNSPLLTSLLYYATTAMYFLLNYHYYKTCMFHQRSTKKVSLEKSVFVHMHARTHIHTYASGVNDEATFHLDKRTLYDCLLGYTTILLQYYHFGDSLLFVSFFFVVESHQEVKAAK